MNTPQRPGTSKLLLGVILAIAGTGLDWGTVTLLRPEAPRGIVEAAPRTDSSDGPTVWGTIKRYTDDRIVVDNTTYPFAPTVLIDTYSLEQDVRGNVRLTLDAKGRVTQVFFYGIDMPDVIRRYKM